MSKTRDIALVNKCIYTLSELTGDFTMPSQQQMLLLTLYEHSVLNQQDLEKHTGVSRSSNSRNIAKLGRGESGWASGPGYVESFEDLNNRRLKLVQLTPKGRALIEEVWGRVYGTGKDNKSEAIHSQALPKKVAASR